MYPLHINVVLLVFYSCYAWKKHTVRVTSKFSLVRRNPTNYPPYYMGLRKALCLTKGKAPTAKSQDDRTGVNNDFTENTLKTC